MFASGARPAYLCLMRKWSLIFVVIAVVAMPGWVEAQCAMCAAIAETDAQGGGTAAAGLNEGILYLMAFPYLIMAAVGYAIYRHKKRPA